MSPVKIIVTFVIVSCGFFGSFIGIISLINGVSENYTIEVINYTTTVDNSVNSRFIYNNPTLIGTIDGIDATIEFPESLRVQFANMEKQGLKCIEFSGHFYPNNQNGNGDKILSSKLTCH
jgi:hypothetical protein